MVILGEEKSVAIGTYFSPHHEMATFCVTYSYCQCIESLKISHSECYSHVKVIGTDKRIGVRIVYKLLPVNFARCCAKY